MPTDINRRYPRRSRASTSLGATVSLAAVVAGFAVLHFIGATLIHHTPAPPPVENAKSMIPQESMIPQD
jgi:hypothetical protein